MQLGDEALVRIGVSTSAEGDEAAFLQGRGISAALIDPNTFSAGAMPSDAVASARLMPGDVVIALRGAANAAATVTDDIVAERPCFATLDVGIVRVEHSSLLPDYVTAVLNLPRTQAALARSRMGDVTPRLPIKALADVDIPVVPLDLQKQVSGLLQELSREEELLARFSYLRRTQINELLASFLWNAAEEPVPGGYPARARALAVTMQRSREQMTNRQTGDLKMTIKKSPSKGDSGTTHVVPSPKGGWDVKRGGQAKPLSHHETKKPAVDAGRQSSRAAGTEFYEHGRDGRIQRKDSHGNDPQRSKG